MSHRYATPVDDPIDERRRRPLIRKTPATPLIRKTPSTPLVRKKPSSPKTLIRNWRVRAGESDDPFYDRRQPALEEHVLEKEQEDVFKREQEDVLKSEREDVLKKGQEDETKIEQENTPFPPAYRSRKRTSRKSINTRGRTFTVLTTTPATTTLSDLCQRIPSIPEDIYSPDFALLVFLVTPAYASSARHDGHVFQETLQRIYNNSNPSTVKLHTLVAVVDRLPHPASSSPSSDHGSEGLAFMFTDDPHDAPGLLDKSQHQPDRTIRDVASSFQVRRSLTFNILSEHTYKGLPFDQDSLADHSSRSYSVQLPLARTIFHNGLPSTLIHAAYSPQSDGQYTRVSARHLNNLTLRLPFFARSGDLLNLDLTAPLVPLTPARSVVAAMGNIIRRLSSQPYSPDNKPAQEDTILASQELETSVQAYFKARNIPPRTVSVWALVIPKRAFSFHSTSMVDVLQPQNLTRRWKDNTMNWIQSATHTPLSLVQHHTRLHKVLSGGGGWGKKAGLLSLDPDSSYSPENGSTAEAPYFEGLDLGSNDQESALKEIVSPGDYIQFYIAPSDHEPIDDPTPSDNSHRDYWEKADFGTIPSTLDAMPQTVDDSSAAAPNMQVYGNYFGALSEVGISLTVNKHDPRHRYKVEQLNQTKIDVPFGRFSLLNLQESKAQPDVKSSSHASDDDKKSRLEELWDKFEGRRSS